MDHKRIAKILGAEVVPPSRQTSREKMLARMAKCAECKATAAVGCRYCPRHSKGSGPPK